MAGALSEAQLDKVADAATANPRSERTLLHAAGREGLRGLANVCERAKAEVRDEHQELARVAAAHRRRFLRHGRTAEGAFRLELQTTPDAGARVMAAVDRWTDVIFQAARRDGRREPHHAYQADALVELVTGVVAVGRYATGDPGSSVGGRGAGGRDEGVGEGASGGDEDVGASAVPVADPAPAATREPGPGRRASVPSATITFLVDAEAFRRGQLAEDECCELAGVGPVPLAMVERYVGQSRLNLVVTRGADIASVVSLGRAIPSVLRTALEFREPTCVVPGCDVASPLEIDHWRVPFAEGGRTELANLARLCPRHHDLKTYRRWTLRGGPGEWEFSPPAAPGPGAADGRGGRQGRDDATGRARPRLVGSEAGLRPGGRRARGPAAETTAGRTVATLFDSA